MMAPEEVHWFMNLAFEFSNVGKSNRVAFGDTMHKLEAVCLKRKAQKGDKESPLHCSTTIKRRALTPLIQGKEVRNVISASVDATITGDETNIDKDTGLAGPWVKPRSSSSLTELERKEYICCND